MAEAPVIQATYRLVLEGPDDSSDRTVLGELTLQLPVRLNETGRVVAERVRDELADGLAAAAEAVRTAEQ